MKRLLRAPQEIFHIASVTNLGRPTCVSKKYTWPLVSLKLSTTTRMFLFLQITKYVYLKTPQPTTLTHCQSLVFSSWRNYDNQHFYCKSMIIFSYLTRFHSSDLQVSFPFWNQYLTTTGAYGWLYIQKKKKIKTLQDGPTWPQPGESDKISNLRLQHGPYICHIHQNFNTQSCVYDRSLIASREVSEDIIQRRSNTRQQFPA